MKATKGLQNRIIEAERFLSQMGRANLPRVYLLDNDRPEQHKAMLQEATSPATSQPVPARFLKRYELENYLLDAQAIAANIAEELQLHTEDPKPPTMEEVRLFMEEMLATEDQRLYPLGKGEPPHDTCKGSAILNRVFERFGLGEDRKTEHGRSIARRMEQTGGLQEIWEVVADIFA